jgi:hypothetical protein
VSDDDRACVDGLECGVDLRLVCWSWRRAIVDQSAYQRGPSGVVMSAFAGSAGGIGLCNSSAPSD